MSDFVTVGIVQADLSSTPLENAEKIGRLVRSGFKNADLVLTPEYSMANPLKVKDPNLFYDIAEKVGESKFLDVIEKVARETGSVVVTHFVEKTATRPRTLSSSIMVGPDGSRKRLYSKIHLFDAFGYRESDFFDEGEALSETVNLKNFKMRVAICYDLRFPELFRLYALEGADIVLVHAGWVKGFMKESQLDFLAKARAHENTFYLVLSNQVGELFTGGSGVYSPLGYKIRDLGFKEAYVEVALDREELKTARELVPVVKQAITKWRVEKIKRGSKA